MKLARALTQTVVLLSLATAAYAQSNADVKRSTPIGVGDIAPSFSLEDQTGRKVSLSEARNKSPVVLVFYRGYW